LKQHLKTKQININNILNTLITYRSPKSSCLRYFRIFYDHPLVPHSMEPHTTLINTNNNKQKDIINLAPEHQLQNSRGWVCISCIYLWIAVNALI